MLKNLLNIAKSPCIYIDKTDLILAKDKTATLTADTNPEGIPVKWSNSDNNVATVKYRGNTCEITAIAEGNATITAEITIGGKKLKDTCDLSVIKSSPEDIAEAYAKHVLSFKGNDWNGVKNKLPDFPRMEWCSILVGETAKACGLSKIIPL